MLSELFRSRARSARSVRADLAAAASPAVVEKLEGRALLSAAPASSVTFTIDAARSFTTLSSSGFATLAPQSAGSLTTHYNGSISTNLGGKSIQFTQSAIAAADNGTYGGTPGDFAAQVAALGQVVLRNVALSLTSGKLALGRAGTFSSRGEKVTLTAGEADYVGTGILAAYHGSKNLAGLSARNPLKTPGTVVVQNGVATLTLPLTAKITLGQGTHYKTTFAVTGQIVATANVA